MAGYTLAGSTTSYTYDEAGIRLSKTINGNTTTFYVVDGELLGQQSPACTLQFLFDENGTKYGLIYNGTTYFYDLNLQGDVVGIIDASGNTVVSYTYDPWGKLLSISGPMGSSLGINNPILYRGYYYDFDSGLYYLQSRYYDPVTGRFLNADNAISGSGDSVQGYNLFVYCNNNPINMTDENGNWPKWLKDTISAISTTIKKITTAIISTSKIDSIKASQHHSAKKYFVPRKDKRKGSENRQKTGSRERNVAHPNGEEHSRVPKGNGVKRDEVARYNDSNMFSEPVLQEKMVASIMVVAGIGATGYLLINDATLIGALDDALIAPVLIFVEENIKKLCY